MTHFAEFLEREAGHVLVSIILLLIAVLLWPANLPGRDLLAGTALGCLSRSMGSK